VGARTGPGWVTFALGSERDWEAELPDTDGSSLRVERGVTPRTVNGAYGFLGSCAAWLEGVFFEGSVLGATVPAAVTGVLSGELDERGA